jgi:ketosteroid isomerase-like protein
LQNVEIAKAAYDAWNKGDLDSVLDRLHPDVEWEENAQVYPLEVIEYQHIEAEERKIARFEAYADRSEAREAVGLEE